MNQTEQSNKICCGQSIHPDKTMKLENRSTSIGKNRLAAEFAEFRLLLASVPPIILTLFIMSVFSMNLLANKNISLPFDWLALDCGIIVSWFSFLTMDMLTNRFGPKAATELSLLAIAINLAFCLLFFLGSLIPGVWGESYVEGSEGILNHAHDHTFGGTWYVLAGSTAAFITSSFLNNFLNHAIGKLFRKNRNGAAAYAVRSYISTAVGQFSDNLVFALLVSHVFFEWTLTQCLTCAATGMLVELLCEIIFSFFGYRICEGWRRRGVGQAYVDYISEKSDRIELN